MNKYSFLHYKLCKLYSALRFDNLKLTENISLSDKSEKWLLKYGKQIFFFRNSLFRINYEYKNELRTKNIPVMNPSN